MSVKPGTVNFESALQFGRIQSQSMNGKFEMIVKGYIENDKFT